MVLILIVSLLGYAFRKTLKEKGLSLLWSLLPILLGLVSIAIAQVAALLVGLILGRKFCCLSWVWLSTFFVLFLLLHIGCQLKRIKLCQAP